MQPLITSYNLSCITNPPKGNKFDAEKINTKSNYI